MEQLRNKSWFVNVAWPSVVGVGASLLVVACSDGHAGEPMTGVVELAIQAPPSVASAKIDFIGETRSANRCVPVDGHATRLDHLPTGSVNVQAAAFSSSDCGGTPTWFAGPMTVTLVPGEEKVLTLPFFPNGVVAIDGEWFPDELTCVGTNRANLALNTAGSGFPTISASSMWGGGQQPWQVQDGATEYANWASGIALNFGGTQFVEIDLGRDADFNELVLWHHLDMIEFGHNVPANVTLEYFDGMAWRSIPAFTRAYDLSVTPAIPTNQSSVPDRYAFGTVHGSRIRWSYDGDGPSVLGYVGSWHGWLYEAALLEACE